MNKLYFIFLFAIKVKCRIMMAVMDIMVTCELTNKNFMEKPTEIAAARERERKHKMNIVWQTRAATVIPLFIFRMEDKVYYDNTRKADPSHLVKIKYVCYWKLKKITATLTPNARECACVFCMKSNWLTIKDVYRHRIFMCCIYEAAIVARIQLIYFGYQQRWVRAFFQNFCLHAGLSHRKTNGAGWKCKK